MQLNQLFNPRLLLLLFIPIAHSCKKEKITIPTEAVTEEQSPNAYFTKFWFDTAHNPLNLNATLDLTINGSSITGRIPYYSNLSALTPSFDFVGDTVWVNGVLQASGTTPQNFRLPVTYQVSNANGVKSDFTVDLLNFTGLPVMKIVTGNVPITSKEEYIDAYVIIDGAGQYDDLPAVKAQIKGRGNSTWGQPKNPYKIKFSSKTSIFGGTKAKQWVLLANYYDKTMLRNATGFFMGRLSNLDWTPDAHFAEVMLNEVYIGTYLITDQVETGTGRVDVGDDGFLIEVDHPEKVAADEITFTTDRLLCVIKDPETEVGDDSYNYVRDYLNNTENALYGDDFKDPETGYAKYLDVNTFVDWYVINEIVKNNDATFFSSCYMNLKRGAKLKMGPLWDFDIAIGNINYNFNQEYYGFYVKNASWISRLFEDPAFVSKVKQRFAYFKSQENDILNFINNGASKLQWAVIENNNKYNTLYTYTWPNYAIWGSYDNEVMYMKTWLDNRLNWLEAAIGAL